MKLSFGKTFYSALAQDQEFIKLSINLMDLKKDKNKSSNKFNSLFSTDSYLTNFEDVSDRKFDKVQRENDLIIQTTTVIETQAVTVSIRGYST
jgi:hypothetical protein